MSRRFDCGEPSVPGTWNHPRRHARPEPQDPPMDVKREWRRALWFCLLAAGAALMAVLTRGCVGLIWR